MHAVELARWLSNSLSGVLIWRTLVHSIPVVTGEARILILRLSRELHNAMISSKEMSPAGISVALTESSTSFRVISCCRPGCNKGQRCVCVENKGHGFINNNIIPYGQKLLSDLH